MITTAPPPDAEEIVNDAVRVAIEGVEGLVDARDEAEAVWDALSPAGQDKYRDAYQDSLQRGVEVLQQAEAHLLEITRSEFGEQGVKAVLQAAQYESN